MYINRCLQCMLFSILDVLKSTGTGMSKEVIKSYILIILGFTDAHENIICLVKLESNYNLCLVKHLCLYTFRFFEYQVGHLNSYFPHLDSGAVCPLCPKVHYINVLFDGSFFAIKANRSSFNVF